MSAPADVLQLSDPFSISVYNWLQYRRSNSAQVAPPPPSFLPVFLHIPAEAISYPISVSLYSFRRSRENAIPSASEFTPLPTFSTVRTAERFPINALPNFLAGDIRCASVGPVEFNSLHFQMTCVINTFLII